MTTKALNAVIEANPDLSAYGWRFNTPQGWNSGLKFDQEREHMQSAEFAKQVELALGYINHRPINRQTSSYGLKHKVEAWLRTPGNHHYISNGAAICAAILAGYEPVRDEVNSPNCVFKRAKQ